MDLVLDVAVTALSTTPMELVAASKDERQNFFVLFKIHSRPRLRRPLRLESRAFRMHQKFLHHAVYVSLRRPLQRPPLIRGLRVVVRQRRLLHDHLAPFLDVALVVLEFRGLLPRTNTDENLPDYEMTN